LKISIVTYEFPPYSGGIGSYCFQLAQALVHGGHEVTVVTTHAADQDNAHFATVVLRTWGGSTGFFLEPLLLWRILSHSGSDVTFITHAKMIRSASIIALWSDVSSIVPLLHGTEISELAVFKGWFGALKRFMFKRFLYSVRRIITNTYHTARILNDSFAVTQNIAVMYPVVDDIFLSTPRKAMHRQSKTLHLLTVARIENGKGHDLVLQALSLLKRDNLSLHYTIVGKGSYEKVLRRMVKELGLESEVHFAGEKKGMELIESYDDCDVFVMPSSIDSFGIVFLEASARNKPVIAGNHGGGAEFVVDGENGFIIANNSAEALAQRLRELNAQPEMVTRMGMNGRNKVMQHFSATAMASAAEKVVVELRPLSGGKQL